MSMLRVVLACLLAVAIGFVLALTPTCASAMVVLPPPAPELPRMPPDNWGGARAHAGYSVLLGAGASYALPKRPWQAWGLCLGVGVVKELHDRQRGQPGYQHGLFSRDDLKADALGCAAGVGLMRWSREF